MMKKITLLMLLCCAFMLPAFAQFSNVPVTGFNADIVADGAVGAGSFSTNASADVAVPPYVFVSSTFNPGSGICASGATALPATNTVTSTNVTNNTGITYTLQSYGNGTATNNNVLQMAYNATGTLTLTTPVSAAKLYLVCLGGSGASSFTAVVNFTDATSQTITNAPAAPDWCGGGGTYKLTSQSYYRINNNSTTCNGGTCQYLYEIPVAIAGANYFKTISSITLTNNSSGTLFSVFAVGAQAPCAAPATQATALVLTPNSTSQISGSFTAATGSPAGYVVVRYPQGSTVTNPESGTTYTVGQTLGLGKVVSAGVATTFADPGLSGGTNYTYYVYTYATGTTCGGPVYNLVTPLTATQSTTACGTMSGTVAIGPGLPNTPAGGFTSLTNALTYINANGLGGNTVLELQTGYIGTSANETFPITFPVNPCVSSSRTLTIRPAVGVTGLTITNLSNDNPVIDFNGATYVTIDGVNNGLTISNTSVASSANTSTIRFINDASNIAIVNCSVLGASTGSLGTNNGTIYFATGTVTGNDNNTIVNCKIGATGATTLPSKGIYSQGSTGSATIANSNIVIASNEIFDYFLTGGCAGVYALTGNTDWTIANNKIYQTATNNFTAAGTMYGIYFVSGTYGQNVQITANTIGYASNAGTGTLTLTGTFAGAFQGINFTGLSSATPTCNISGNTISDISLTSSSGGFTGIVNGTGASANTININGNQVKNIALLTTTGTSYGISWGAATTMSVNGNTVNNISRSGAGTLYGIFTASASSSETINNNTITNLSSTAATASTLYGISQASAAGTKVFQNNQIYNFSGLSGTTMYGIRVGSGTTIDISGNTIYILNSTGGTGGSVYGINTGTSGTTFNVYKNKVYGLNMSSTGGVVYGIYNASSVANIYNNLVGDLASTVFSSTSSPYLGLAGIYISSGNSNIYNNTVRIGAITSSGTNFTATGIYTNTSPTVLLQNNLVVNLATAVGSGKTVSYMRSGTTLTTYAAASNTNSFYSGTPSASKVIFWDGTNAYQDLTAYKAAMITRDQFSLDNNPSFISTVGADATYLHIPAGGANVLESAGTNVALFNTDYDGNNRPGPTGSVNGGALFYDIGADEFDAVPAFTCTTPTPGNTVASPSTICLGSPVTVSLQTPTTGNAVAYVWYSSTDGTNYTVINGATSSTYTTIPLVPTYFKATVTCGGTLSTTSTPVLVTFTNLVTNTVPAQRCGTGTLSLGATASSGTLKWYNTQTGGPSIATGSPYVTPIISNTTTYYVEAESASPGEVAIGTATTLTSGTSYPTAFMNRHTQYWHQMVFTADELIASGLRAGNITALKFNITSIGDAANVTNFSIMLGTTSNTTLSAFTTTGLTPVYGPSTYTQTIGVNTIAFSSPYSWDGTSNIIVDLRQTGVDNINNAITYFTATPGNTTVYAFTSSATPSLYTSGPTPTTSTSRLNTVFVGQTACASPRVPVTATVNTAPAFSVTADQTVCNGGIVPLTVTSPAGSYNVYNWTPITDLYTDAAATIPYTTGTSASTVYLKSTTEGIATYVANASNTTTQCAAVDTTIQTVLPATVTTIAMPSPICVSGTAILALNPATGYGAATFQWQSSADNTTFANISGATTATYTTPVTSTTYYRANIVNSAGVTCLGSVSDTVRVNNPLITATTPGARCGNGTVTLGAVASEGAINWYAASSGGSSLGTGSPFTTPTINTTTTYYVSAESGSTVNATIGTDSTLTSATSQPTAFCNRWKQYWCQMVYTAAELTAAGLNAGNISSITFNITTLGDGTNVTNFTVAMGTAPSTLTAFTTTGLATVYGPSTYTHAIGANTITFATPYVWDGISNILVDLRQTGNDQTNNAITYFTATTNNTCASATTSATSPDLATNNPTPTLNTQRLNIIFNQPPCSGPRVPVIATVNTAPAFTITADQTICNGAITPLAVTSTVGSFNTYNWTPVTNLYTDAAATVPYTTGTNAATVYLKSTTPGTATYIANASNATTLCAAVDTTIQTVLPAAVTATATPSSICVSGTATLALTPATGYGAATIQWQSSANNTTFANVSGANTTTYTTPVTTSTTYYRANIMNSAGTTCLNSTSDTARVYNPAITGTTPASRCGPGTLTLGATGTDGTLRWYSGLTGGTSLASGNSFTTPSITGTTTYYVGSEIPVQGVVTVGAGASTTVSSTSSADEISPFDHYYGGFKSQNLITAAELNAAGLTAGNIYSLAFDVVAGGGLFEGFNMSIGTTAAAALTTTPVGGLTPVYTTTAPAGLTTPASGLVTVNFSSPYLWDGTSNLVIQTCWSNNNGGGTGTTVKYDATPFVSHSYYEADNQLPSAICDASTMNSTLLSSRPKMVINGTAICSSTPRTPVIATVNPNPVATITPSGTVTICSGATTTLTAGGGGTYQWRDAAGNISSATNGTYTTGTAGTYRVIATTTATGCKDTSAVVTLNVSPIPTVFIGNDTTFCSGNTLTLNAGNTGGTYLWDNASTNQTRNVTATGTYYVKVTNSSNCSKNDTINVTVNPTPVVNLGNDTNLCLGVNYVLNAGNPAASRLWDNGTTGQTRTVTNTGTYYVRVTNGFNCTARDTVVTTFYSIPTVNLGSNQDVCEGVTVTLDAGNPGETYLWDNASTSQTRSVTTTGNYFVTVNNIANCRGSDTVQVTFHPLPIVDLGNDTAFCYGNTLTLNAGNPGASYLWSTNSTSQTINVNTTGNYNVVVTDIYSCVGSDNINILVKDPPSGIINAVHGDTATYTFNVLNPQYVTGYIWNFGDGSPTAVGPVVQHRYANNGIYTVTVILEGECSDSAGKSRTVDVYDASGGTGIDQIKDSKELILYPNPARDVVIIENKKNFSMKQVALYNVVGQMISTAKADSPDKHKLNTSGLASGVYTIRIETDKGFVIRKFEIMK
ncbi:MAG: T9SS type A sorting domain-containing protein [Taibaiella sp.]|jgi:hypothetical protein